MNEFDIQNPVHMKEQHSEIFTLRSIGSQEEILQLVPIYNEHGSCEQYNSGHWTPKQHIKYIMFIDYFSDIFTIKHNKKLWKIFTIMSAFIKTRNSSQCRSHHQKNQRKHKSISEILELQRAKYKNYTIQFEKIKKVLRKLPIHNPIEVENQKSTMVLISSIKVLQQDLEYQVYKNPISMRNIQISKKDLKQIKNRNSEKIILKKEKYIGSQISIEMEDESEEGYNDRVRSLYVDEIEPQQSKQKNMWNYGSSGIDSSYKKDEKLDKTADSYMDGGFKNPQDLKPDLNPVKQSEHSDINQNPFAQNLRNYINIVKMKKTRSSLPSFEDFNFDGEETARLGQRLRNSKKQSGNSEGKCKTLPPRSAKIDNSDESWPSQKINGHQRTARKSLFSGFISSCFEESNKAFEANENIHPQNQYASFNNFSYGNEFHGENEKFMDLRRRQHMSEGDFVEPKINLLFIEDEQKVNLCNQISVGQFQNSMSFVQQNAFKFEQSPERLPVILQKVQSLVKNFSKKRSREPQLISEANQQEIKQVEHHYHLKKMGSQEIYHSQRQLNTQSQHFLSNSENFRPNLQNQYQGQYFYGQNPGLYPPIYDSYWYVPQHYPLLEYKLYKFIEFFIYFIIHKIVANNLCFQVQ